MRISLSNYLTKVEACYQKARKEWEAVQREADQEEKRYNSVEWLYLTPEGKTAEHNKHVEALEIIKRKCEVIQDAFNSDFEKIQADADKVFDYAHKHKPEKIDTNGLAILNNSNLEINELIDLAEDYRAKGNSTMYFLVAEKLKQEGDYDHWSKEQRKAQAYYEEAHTKRTTREDHELMEGFKTLCEAGLRSDKLLANGIHNIHEAEFNRYSNGAKEIFTDAPAPWSEE